MPDKLNFNQYKLRSYLTKCVGSYQTKCVGNYLSGELPDKVCGELPHKMWEELPHKMWEELCDKVCGELTDTMCGELPHKVCGELTTQDRVGLSRTVEKFTQTEKIVVNSWGFGQKIGIFWHKMHDNPTETYSIVFSIKNYIR